MKGDVFKIELEKERNPKPQTEQLPLSNHIMLYEKHPETMPAKSSVLFRGPVEDIQQAIYFPINSEMVREAVLKTKRSAGGPVVRMLMELRELLLVNSLRIHH